MSTGPELNTAIAMAKEAGGILTSHFRSVGLDVRTKGERDVVTLADMAAEELLSRRLKVAFPDDGIVGEEGSATHSSGGRTWYVDPLDGTLNYSRGLPVWCVSISLFEDNEPILGVIHDPLRGETYSAVRGGGAWCNSRRLNVSSRSVLADALIHLTVDFKESSLLVGLEDLQRIAPRVMRTRNIGSAALALAYVASGYFDGMLHRSANTWDYGAGVLLVREAGGTVSSMDGSAYIEGTESVLAASAPSLHADLLRLTQEGRGPRIE